MLLLQRQFVCAIGKSALSLMIFFVHSMNMSNAVRWLAGVFIFFSAMSGTDRRSADAVLLVPGWVCQYIMYLFYYFIIILCYYNLISSW